MHRITLFPGSRLNCTISLPSSKSISNRALVINALSGAQTHLQNISDCDDTRVMKAALAQRPTEIDIMAAGTAMRFLSAFLSVQPEETHILTGTKRMCRRPIGVLVDALRELGADIEYLGQKGFPPLRIIGKRLQGGCLSLPADISSQYISALLMIGPQLEQGLRLKLSGEPVSRPYIDMTLSLMHAYGSQAMWTDENTLCVTPQPYTPVSYVIENDWSAASYWYEIIALSSDPQACVRLPGLCRQSTQGDASVAEIFSHLGIETRYEEETVCLSKGKTATAHLTWNLLEQPDLAQTLVATCLAMGTTFHFTGLQSLRIKETDRLSALIKEFRKLGFVLQERADSQLLWLGERCKPQQIPTLDTYEDHRMAMSLAPCCLRLGPLSINNPEVVSKSYPHFWEDLKQAGFKIEQ